MNEETSQPNKPTRLTLDQLAEILGTTAQEIVTVSFNDERMWILLANLTGPKVLFKVEQEKQYQTIRHCLPEEFTFGGFTHTQEEITFTTMVKMGAHFNRPETLLDALWQ